MTQWSASSLTAYYTVLSHTHTHTHTHSTTFLVYAFCLGLLLSSQTLPYLEATENNLRNKVLQVGTVTCDSDCSVPFRSDGVRDRVQWALLPLWRCWSQSEMTWSVHFPDRLSKHLA